MSDASWYDIPAPTTRILKRSLLAALLAHRVAAGPRLISALLREASASILTVWWPKERELQDV